MNDSDKAPQCPGLAEALKNSKIVLPFPDYTAILVWYGGTNVHILDGMGCTLSTQDIGTNVETEVRQRMEAFIEKLNEHLDEESD